MRLTPAVRQDAVRAQRTLSKWGWGFSFSGAAAALKATQGQDPALAAWAAICAMLSIACHATAWVKGRVAGDPPSEYYESPTRPHRRSLNLEQFVVPEDPALRTGFRELASLSEVGPALGQSLFDEGAQLGAFIRAFERAQGAQLADADLFLEARARESEEYAHRASALLRESAGLSADLARSLDTAEVLDDRYDAPIYLDPNKTFEAILPESALVTLYRAGIRINELRRPVTRQVVEMRDLTTNLRHELTEGYGDLEALGRELSAWSPWRDLGMETEPPNQS